MIPVGSAPITLVPDSSVKSVVFKTPGVLSSGEERRRDVNVPSKEDSTTLRMVDGAGVIGFSRSSIHDPTGILASRRASLHLISALPMDMLHFPGQKDMSFTISFAFPLKPR